MFDTYEDRSKHTKSEKAKAKELRKSRWWQNLIQSANCYYCQKTIKLDEVTMDHIVPVSRGGYSSKGNVVPACKDCNTHKKDKTAVELLLEGRLHEA